MKVQATVLLSFQARTLAQAGELLDDVLARARERDDVDIGCVELASPPGVKGTSKAVAIYEVQVPAPLIEVQKT